MSSWHLRVAPVSSSFIHFFFVLAASSLPNAKGLKSSKMDQNIPNTIEARESMDGEVEELLIEEKMEETRPTTKICGEADIKTLIAEEMSKKDDHKRRPKLPLLRTDSIHHLEISDDRFLEDMRAKQDRSRIDPCLYNVSATGKSKVIPDILKPPETDTCSKEREVCGTMKAESELGRTQNDESMQLIQNNPLLQDKLNKGLLKKKYMDASDLITEDSLPQTKEFLDVLDVFQVNKELFFKVLQDPDSSSENNFQNVQNSNANTELTKSGSFPITYLSRNNASSSNIKNNLKEIIPFTKQERQLQAGRSPTKLTKSGSFPMMADGNEQERLGTAEPCKDSGCSLGSSHALKNQGDNPVVTNRFKNNKQRIKQAIKDSGSDHHRISMDATLHKITYGHNHSKDGKKEISDHWKKPTTNTDFKDSPSSYGSGSSLYALSQGGFNRIRRSASLNESLSRYSQLFESTFSAEPAPKAFGRMLSLPCSLQSEAETSCLGTATSIHVDRPANIVSDQQKLSGLDKGGFHCIRRTASLNESPDRYSQLSDSAFSTEAKQHLSDRFKLTNEDEGSPGGPAPKSFGRMLSLPELTSSSSLQSEGTATSIHVEIPAFNMDSDQQKLAGLDKGGFHCVRRTASLNESPDRYSQLFESDFSTEAKQHLSDRLRLTNEDEGSPGRPAPKSFGRMLSLPCSQQHLSDRLRLTNEDGGSPSGPAPKSFGRILSLPCSLQSEVDTSCLGTATSIHVDRPANMGSDQQKLADLSIYRKNDFELEASAETVTQEILVEVSESTLIQGDEVGLILNPNDDSKADKMSDNLENETMMENSSIFHHQQEVELATNACVCVEQKRPSPNSVLDSHPSEFSIKEETDSMLKPNHIDFDGLDSLVNMPYGNGSTTEIENVKIQSKHFVSDLPHIQVDKKDEADFNYVRDVLKIAGFSGNEKLRTWYLPDQPIDPSLFEELDCSRQEAAGSSCDQQLLFDIVNEVLVDIYERSFMYWPRPLSNKLNIRPMPMGIHVLEDVWTSISWFLRYQPEPDLSLDYIVSRDLAKADGWMNLQFESECAGLMLEEWIWDELLEEVILEFEVA
ncbi:hypothetical protein NE237_008590 [Protea cynaroides]|uniref:DUF4378 domain-containing protein n=1 Tax=Protea cynaroides TaxID=273540 RepID=A0A9Q0KW28_9MAGN|nr:hypothetical protein NE237_008590 [Protea cynaroides]